MILSVIIVNYNVRHFLEQCLHSVVKATGGLNAEIFVVDNDSADGSCQMVREKFPGVKLISNQINLGFSKANNQAIRQSSGKYVLLLNPDTVVEECTFTRVLDFMEEHEEAGGLGVKMIDGKGKFLPESKRGLPTPAVAFYKISGLSRLFPHSRIFNRYHLGYLDVNKVHEIEVLSGAFMLLRKSALDLTGLLDEEYFMYGEDIDLSYRLMKNGYKNYYFPGTTIIHYKGESTRKSSINYVIMFYNAMIIFARKHFSHQNASIFSFLISLAIYFRAFAALMTRFVRLIFLPLCDAALIFSGYLIVMPAWEHHKPGGGSYPSIFIYIAVPLYILIWLLTSASMRAYKKPYSIWALVRGLSIGTLTIILIYSLLNEQYRFSRLLIIFGYAWSVLSLCGLRMLLHWTGIKSFRLDFNKKKKILIVSSLKESERIGKLLSQADIRFEISGVVYPVDGESPGEGFIGDISHLKEITQLNEIDEIIFSSGDISSQEIIRNMHHMTGIDVDYKIAPPESLSVIGSNSFNSAGDLYIVRNNSIGKKGNRRKKRVFDLTVSLILLFCSPLIAWFFKNPGYFLNNILKVLKGNWTWIGYDMTDPGIHEIPELKPGVLTTSVSRKTTEMTGELAGKLNLAYSRDYRLINDLILFYRGFSKSGERNGPGKG